MRALHAVGGGRGVAHGLGSAAAAQEKTELAASLRSALAAATAKAASLEESVAALKLVLAAAWEWEWEWAALTLLVACLQVKDDVMAKLTAASRQLTHLKAGAGLDGHTHGDALVLENAELHEALQRKDDRMREMLEYIVRTLAPLKPVQRLACMALGWGLLTYCEIVRVCVCVRAERP